MNANDLADRLEQFYTGTHIQKAAETLRQQQSEIEYWKEMFDKAMKSQEKYPPASWWKGDPTCGGITENYGLGKAQEK